MKILQVINRLNIAGAETLLVNMVLNMSRKGHEVDVLLFNPTPCSLTEKLIKAGINIISVSNNEYNPLGIFKFKPYLKAGYDVIHSHLFPSQYWVGIAKFIWGTHTPIITTEHSTSNSRERYWLTRQTDKFVYKQYDAITAISQSAKDFLTTKTMHTQTIVVIENGIDLQSFNGIKETRADLLPALAENCFLLVQVARFQAAKNQHCVIRALSLLPDDVHIAFVGDGELRAECEQLAYDSGVDKRVHFVGVQSNIPAWMSIADVVVMSSHWEGFGLSAVEGMAASKPVLASNVDGLAQVVENTELLFTENDEADLAQKILWLKNDALLRTKLGVSCHHTAMKYDISFVVDKYLALYEKLKRKQ